MQEVNTEIEKIFKKITVGDMETAAEIEGAAKEHLKNDEYAQQDARWYFYSLYGCLYRAGYEEGMKKRRKKNAKHCTMKEYYYEKINDFINETEDIALLDLVYQLLAKEAGKEATKKADPQNDQVKEND